MDLTSLARVRQYAPIAATSTNVDPLTRNFIHAESRVILRHIGIACPHERVSKVLDGSGTSRLFLPRTPVLRINSLAIQGVTIAAAASPLSPGFQLGDDCITLNNGVPFPNLRSVVAVDWDAGFQGTTTALIPTGNTSQTITPDGDDVEDGFAATAVSVVVDDVAFVVATTANAPLAGQYGLADGVFYFNGPTDGGKTAVLLYYFVPGPIVQSCSEMVALDLQQRNNPGIKSKGLANESVVYDSASMTPSVKAMLRPYTRIAPTA